MVKKLDHVGIVVNNLDESIPIYERILGVKPVAVQDVPTQSVRAAFFEVGNGVEVELIQPIIPDSGVARFLKKHGQGVHHICFEVDEVDKELKAMADKEIEPVSLHGQYDVTGKIGFLHPKSTKGVLIEFAQYKNLEKEISVGSRKNKSTGS